MNLQLLDEANDFEILFTDSFLFFCVFCFHLAQETNNESMITPTTYEQSLKTEVERMEKLKISLQEQVGMGCMIMLNVVRNQ